MLKKDEVIELIKGALSIEKKEAEGFLKEIDTIMETLSNALPVGEKANLGHYLTVEKRHVDAKDGVAMGKEYHTEAKDVLKAKISKKLDK